MLTGAGETVTIESLAAGGAGVTHLSDGMIAFVPRTAPGDLVVLGAVRRHRRHADAQPSSLVSPGPGRVEPPCMHFVRDRCGGCQWQHLSAEVQAAAKRRIVGDALRRIGGLDVPDPEIVTSPRELGYRAAMTLTVRWRRGGPPVVGFHDGVDPERVFSLGRCAIARGELNDLWEAVRPEMSALPRGEDVRLRLRVEGDGSRHLLVSGGEGAWTRGEPLAAAAARAGIPVTVWWQPPGGAVRRMAGAEGDPAAVAFGQVNPEIAAQLREAVVAVARGATGPGPARILDLYAGAGETAIPLAADGNRVVLIESELRAVRRAEQRAGASGVTLRCIAGRVEDHVGSVLPADVVIVNPPRAGLGQSVADRLREARPRRLIYVSCDPATLARDLRRMGIGTTGLRMVRAFDMFPQTSHVETLVEVEAA